jgi:hypothetical protein
MKGRQDPGDTNKLKLSSTQIAMFANARATLTVPGSECDPWDRFAAAGTIDHDVPFSGLNDFRHGGQARE